MSDALFGGLVVIGALAANAFVAFCVFVVADGGVAGTLAALVFVLVMNMIAYLFATSGIL